MKNWLPLGDHTILGELAFRKHTHLTIERAASADRFLSVAFALFNTRDIGLAVIATGQGGVGIPTSIAGLRNSSSGGRWLTHCGFNSGNEEKGDRLIQSI